MRPELPVQHYGPVPKADAATWLLTFGVSTGGADWRRVSLADLDGLPRERVEADLHCAVGWTAPGNLWEGIRAANLVELFPPPRGTVGVMVFGEYGYSANVRLSDLLAPTTLLATHLAGHPLTPQHGYPVRLILPHLYAWKGPKWFRGWEYLSRSRRGFWEERGYHVRGEVSGEQRYSYEE